MIKCVGTQGGKPPDTHFGRAYLVENPASADIKTEYRHRRVKINITWQERGERPVRRAGGNSDRSHLKPAWGDKRDQRAREDRSRYRVDLVRRRRPTGRSGESVKIKFAWDAGPGVTAGIGDGCVRRPTRDRTDDTRTSSMLTCGTWTHRPSCRG